MTSKLSVIAKHFAVFHMKYFSYFSSANVTHKYFEGSNVFQAKARLDWRDRGAVTAVKNQGSCGSCWAFSTTGSIESQMKIKFNRLVSLSEQNLVDCSYNYNNNGCGGGLMNNAFQYIIDNGGIDDSKSYPYLSIGDSEYSPRRQCRYNPRNAVATVTGYRTIRSGSEKDLTQAVTQIGPIAVAMHSTESFQHYKSGYFYERNCPNDAQSINHAVLVVGYGTDPKYGKYYIVKNSWATTWGEHGFAKMARDRNNNCGIATLASYPLVERK